MKKTLTFFYSLYIPTDFELDYIRRFYTYVKSHKNLNKEIDIIIYDDTPEYKYKSYFDKLNIETYNSGKNLRKNGALHFVLNKVNSKYLKFIDPDDYIIFEWLDELVQVLKKWNYDFITHAFYKLKKTKLIRQNIKNNAKELYLANFIMIYSVRKLKNFKDLLKINMLFSQDQYLGMVVAIDCKRYRNLNLPFYIHNYTSSNSIWYNMAHSPEFKLKYLDKVIEDVDQNIKLFKKYELRFPDSIKPKFINILFYQEKFSTKKEIYDYIKKNMEPKKFSTKFWIWYNVYYKLDWR